MKERKLTPQEKIRIEIYNKVHNFKTKYPEGFIYSEIVELLKEFPDIDMDKFNGALYGNTAILSNDNEIISFHTDIYHAILCGVEKRDLSSLEWD